MRKLLISIAASLFLMAVMTAIYMTGALEGLSNRINDWVYQRGNIPSGTISIIQIDEKSLSDLGPYNTWTRDNVALAIEKLNSNPNAKPAVIGVDILYIGYSNEDSDNHLAEAAKEGENLVFGSYVNLNKELVENETGYDMQTMVTLYEEPFEELSAVSRVGFVNGFSDSDGIVRHGLKQIENSDGSVLSAFALEIAKAYAETVGEDIDCDIPTDKKGFWYIDYTGRPGTYSNEFSISDLLKDEIPPEYFEDGIVLIGPYAEGMMDSYMTSIDRMKPMYGVEIHANQVESILEGRYKKEVTKGIFITIIMLTCFGAVFSCYKRKLAYNVIFSTGVVVIYIILCKLLYNKGYLLPVVYVPFIVILVLVMNIVIHYLMAAMEKQRVERTFKRYVAPEVIDTITKEGLDSIKLGGEAVDCAILFVDIRGFTTMSESLEPETVVSILNRYLELTSSCIFDNGGTLDKFIGDATMAIFGAPVKMEDYVYKAVCAAYDMVVRAEEMSKELEKEYGKSVSFGVGVNCGKAVVGNIGTLRRMDYTAIGDTVNTAARLEANAPRGTVYISDEVYKRLEGRIKAESVGRIPLKGKSADIEVYKLLSI